MFRKLVFRPHVLAFFLCAFLFTIANLTYSYAQSDNSCPIKKSALISTAGDSSGSGKLSQSFVVAPGFGSLAGRVKFLSDEWPDYFGTEFNDSFLARISTPSGTTVLASGNVNSSSWSSGVSGFNGQTMEKNFTYNISPFTGKTVNLTFEVRDVGDLIVDSGLAISDVRMVRTEQFVTAATGSFAGNGGSITGKFGQAVRLTFKNLNLLGTTIEVTESRFGETKGAIILPLKSVTFNFTIFGEEPISWNFNVSTNSDAFVVGYTVESTWVEGMPDNPCF